QSAIRSRCSRRRSACATPRARYLKASAPHRATSSTSATEFFRKRLWNQWLRWWRKCTLTASSSEPKRPPSLDLCTVFGLCRVIPHASSPPYVGLDKPLIAQSKNPLLPEARRGEQRSDAPVT